MRLKNVNEVSQRKSEALKKLSKAYSSALKSGTVRKVVSSAKS